MRVIHELNIVALIRELNLIKMAATTENTENPETTKVVEPLFPEMLVAEEGKFLLNSFLSCD